MIGSELSGRYDIIDRIGEGGMAIVYKANDILLNRHVAIKVLRQQYVHDDEFIRRFRREAQSAAALSHPNVVSIYDVGQQDEVHYIVMEYIEGHTLSERIIQKAPFQVEEAVHIASQICDALDHAHHNQIIHRDIKPHNILIGRNGRVKVTDFGIARAASAMDITQTGSVIGSVHYFSPEHAKGVTQGESSDLYSLGIVMYQMLTNTLPFLGESPISVALKHLQDKVVEPRSLNPLIPQSVENIILKALRKAPEDRYRSAHVMLEELDKSLLPENRNVPIQTFATEESYDDIDRTLVMPAIRSERPFTEQAKEEGKNRPFAELYEDEEKQKTRKVWIKPLIWFVVLSLIVIAGWTALKSFLADLDLPKDVAVPYVIGLTIDQARVDLEEAGFIVDELLEYEFDDEAAIDVVIDQGKHDIELKEGSVIKLTLSKGVELDVMPDYVNEKWVDVEARLKSLGLTIASGQVEMTMIKDEAVSGSVIAQSPAALEEYNPKAADFVVKITVSEGLGTVEMPNLIGSTESEAESMLYKVGLELDPAGPQFDSSFSFPKGQVFHQFPAEPGEPVDLSEKIKIWVSSGYPEDALSPVWNVTVAPEFEDEPSTVRIIVRDARGEEIEQAPVEISTITTFRVQLVVSKDISARIRVLVNDKVYNDAGVTVTYQDVQEQGASGESSTNSSSIEGDIE